MAPGANAIQRLVCLWSTLRLCTALDVQIWQHRVHSCSFNRHIKKPLYVKTVKLLSLVVGPHTPSPTTSAMKENTWKSFYSSHKHDCSDRHRTRRQRCSSVSCEPHTNMHKVPAETDFTDSRWVTIGPWRLSLHIQTGGADHVQSNPVVQGENKQGEGLQVIYLFFLFNISKPHNHLTGIQAPAATSFQCNIALLCAELVVKVNCYIIT